MSIGGVDSIAGVGLAWWVAGGAGLLLLMVIAAIVSSASKSRKGQRSGAMARPSAATSARAMTTAAASKPFPTDASPAAGHPKPASANATPIKPADAIEGDFTSLAGWMNAQLEAPLAQLSNGEYVFNAHEGALSVARLPAKAGDKFAVEYAVKVVRPTSNGIPAQYVVGACFADASGTVLSWGSFEAPLGNESRVVTLEQVAPENTSNVRLFISGYWTPEPPAPDGQLAFAKASLRRVSESK